MKRTNNYSTLFFRTFLSASFLLTSCSDPIPTFSLLPDQNVFQQQSNSISNKIDILWVIDNSLSMEDNQQKVKDNFDAFITDFITKGFDFQIAVTNTEAYKAIFTADDTYAQYKDGDGTTSSGITIITPDTPDIIGTFQTNIIQGTGGSGDERAFQSLKEALTNPINDVYGFPRADAFLAVIIVSDEDDFSHDGSAWQGNDYNDPNLHPVSDYIDFLDGLTNSSGATRRYSVSSIAIFDPACKTQSFEEIGIRYGDLTDATGGVKGSVCGDFAQELNKIQNKIAELSTQFFLSRVPFPDSIVVVVDGVQVPNDPFDGFSYNAEANSIIFHGSYIPAQNSVIIVDFDPVTVK